MKDFKNKYRSQSNRLPEFDYTQGFWYYVTICTKGMTTYFGKVENGKMKLNRYGKIAYDYWKELPEHLPVSIDEFIIMPNHMHGIVILENEENIRRGLIHQTSFNKKDDPKGDLINQRALINQGSTNDWILMKQEKTSLGKVIRYYKAKVTHQIRNEIDKYFAWQSNYYEHIIRNQQDLERIRYYIKNNPLKWEIDKYYR